LYHKKNGADASIDQRNLLFSRLYNNIIGTFFQNSIKNYPISLLY
jgi:hypothetical protein